MPPHAAAHFLSFSSNSSDFATGARVSSASQARRDEPKKWEVTGLKMAEGEEDEEEEGEEEAVLRHNIAVAGSIDSH